MESPSMGLLRRPTPGEKVEDGRFSRLPGYENWALATTDGEDQVVMMVNAGDGSSNYAELVLEPVFRALCAIQSTSS
jgi:hypothetical protein